MTNAAALTPLTLDLRRFDGDAEERLGFLEDLRHAIQQFGSFYLTGFGVASERFDDLFRLSRRFFDLPEREKLAIEMVNSPHFRGYTRPGWELTRGRADWREQVDIGSERPVLSRSDDGPAWRRLQGPNQWPDALPELRPAVLGFQEDLTVIARTLLSAVAVAIGQEEDAFERVLGGEPTQLVKLIRYPGLDALPADGGAPDGEGQGVGPHKDSGLLTFVLQHEQSGLQLETAAGWIDVPPVPGTLVANAGELLELATDGFFRAAVHRVVTPAAGRDRLSIAFFLGAQLDIAVPVLPLPPELAAEARGPERDPNNPLLRVVGENTLKSRLRSHPDVAQRHYADLLAATA